MKSILFSTVIFMFLCGPSPIAAQEKQDDQKASISPSEKQQNYYVEKLKLNTEKAEKFEAIHIKYEDNVRALKIKSKSKKTVKKLKALEQLRDNDIKALLSEEKFKEYLKLRREKRNSLKTLIRKSNRQ